MTAPNPLWYTTRGLGIVMLLTLTGVVVLGIAGTQRWKSEAWPGFVLQGLHRNLALLTVALLPLHAGTVLLDTFAGLGWKDVLVPFGSSYRPLWLGLGVLGGELLIALVATSLVRRWLGPRLWRATHWAVYAAWPLAMLHGLGTGSDSRAGWAVFLYLCCALGVLAALLVRLLNGRPETRELRRVALGAVVLAAGVGVVWALNGPLHSGWAAAAGTPSRLLASTRTGAPASSPKPPARTQPSPAAPALPAGLDDRLRGSVAQQGAAYEITLQDRSRPGLQIVIDLASADATTGPLRVLQGGQVICQTQATFTQEVDATCGQTALQIGLEQDFGGGVAGELITQGTT